jgi:hypothetical protein
MATASTITSSSSKRKATTVRTIRRNVGLFNPLHEGRSHAFHHVLACYLQAVADTASTGSSSRQNDAKVQHSLRNADFTNVLLYVIHDAASLFLYM